MTELDDRTKSGKSADSSHTAQDDDPITDHRALWDWKSKYPEEARGGIKREAIYLGALLGVLIVITSLCFILPHEVITVENPWHIALLGKSPISFAIDVNIILQFLCGVIGATTFSLKWLIHSAAKGLWHLDRRYWRVMTPILGGVYACVVMSLFNGGALPQAENIKPQNIEAYAFLVGYFSDGVSGLLSNIAKAVFGTLSR